MVDLATAVAKAKTSPLHRRMLNYMLDRLVPFNKPHGLRIVDIDEHQIKTRIPYIKKNLNHIGGLHACALATLSEFTTGFLLLSRLDSKQYRLIMKRLEMDYHYQGKMEATAIFTADSDWLRSNVLDPLVTHDAVEVVCEIRIHDKAENHLTTGRVFWQIKDWNKVKTRTPV